MNGAVYTVVASLINRGSILFTCKQWHFHTFFISVLRHDRFLFFLLLFLPTLLFVCLGLNFREVFFFHLVCLFAFILVIGCVFCFQVGVLFLQPSAFRSPRHTNLVFLLKSVSLKLYVAVYFSFLSALNYVTTRNIRKYFLFIVRICRILLILRPQIIVNDTPK